MNRMIIKRLIFLTLIVFTFQQCAKSKTDLNPEASKSIIKGAPDWYLDTPTKEGFKLVSSSATSLFAIMPILSCIVFISSSSVFILFISSSFDSKICVFAFIVSFLFINRTILYQIVLFVKC